MTTTTSTRPCSQCGAYPQFLVIYVDEHVMLRLMCSNGHVHPPFGAVVQGLLPDRLIVKWNTLNESPESNGASQPETGG